MITNEKDKNYFEIYLILKDNKFISNILEINSNKYYRYRYKDY